MVQRLPVVAQAVEKPCHQDVRQNECIMTEEGNLLNLTPGRPMVFQNKAGALLPVSQRLFTTKEGAVAMDALACCYARKGDIHHGRVGAGLTLTLDMAVGRAVGGIAGAKMVAKKKNAQAEGNAMLSKTESIKKKTA